jgi:hypothetical protein
MRKTACPVVWKGHGAKAPCPHPIVERSPASSFSKYRIEDEDDDEVEEAALE